MRNDSDTGTTDRIGSALRFRSIAGLAADSRGNVSLSPFDPSHRSGWDGYDLRRRHKSWGQKRRATRRGALCRKPVGFFLPGNEMARVPFSPCHSLNQRVNAASTAA
jgi:hypothetical protein